jgi:hypothetical protein
MLQASAEREAWKIAKEHDLDLVTILPNFILGPALSRYDSKGLSVGFMKVSIIARQKDQTCQYTLQSATCETSALLAVAHFSTAEMQQSVHSRYMAPGQ